MPLTDATRGTLNVAAASVLFGTIGLFVTALDALPLPLVVGLRFAFAAAAFPVAYALVPAWRDVMRFRREHAALLVALGVTLLSIDTLFYIGIGRIGMGLATILLATAPVYVALGEWAVLGRRPEAREWAGIAVGLAGVTLIVRPDAGAGLDPGLLAGVGAGVAWAAWLLLSRAAGTRGATGEAQAAASVVVAALVGFPIALALAPVVPTGSELALAAVLGVIPGGLTVMLFARGLRFVDATRAAVIAYLEPLTAVALAAAFLGERYGAWELAGSALVIMGTALVTIRAPTPHARAP